MPNLGPGAPNNTNVGASPTWVFTPTPNVQASVRFYNPGPGTVYVGPNPTPSTGLPLQAGNRPIELQNIGTTLYACTSFTKGAVAATMSASAITAGSTSLATTAAVPTSLASGATFVLGTGTGQEALVVASTAANSTITFASAALFDHVASSVINIATFTSAPLVVNAGVL